MLRGSRVAHVFDITQTDGDPLPEVRLALLTGAAPVALWDALAAQVTGHRYTVSRDDCVDANGLTDPAARTVRVRPAVTSGPGGAPRAGGTLPPVVAWPPPDRQ